VFLLPISFFVFIFPLISCYWRLFVPSSHLLFVFFSLSGLATRDPLLLLPVSFFFFLFSYNFFDLKCLFVIISTDFIFLGLVTLSIYTTDSALEYPVSQEINV
jgi:hypothetical protein